MELYYQKTGNGHPLIILHGLFGMSDNWISIARKLGEHYSVYLPDLRNHGRSPHHSIFTYVAMVDDLLEFMDTHELTTSHIMGHSMGGKVAMQFALDYPEKVDKLIIADIAPGAYHHSHDQLIDHMLDVNVSQYQSRSAIRLSLKEKIPDERILAFLLKNLHWKDKSSLGWKVNLEVIKENMEEIFRQIDSAHPFDKQTFFLKGELSKYITETHRTLIEKLFPHSQTKTIKGASHWLHAEKPVEFISMVEDFLKE
jgi:esterase